MAHPRAGRAALGDFTRAIQRSNPASPRSSPCSKYIILLSINFIIVNFRRVYEYVIIGLPAGWREGKEGVDS